MRADTRLLSPGRCIEVLPILAIDLASLATSASLSVTLCDGIDVQGNAWDALIVRAHSGALSNGGTLTLAVYSVDRRPGLDFIDEVAAARVRLETFPSLACRALPIGIGPSLRLVFEGTKGTGATNATVSAALVRR